eukprot:CAMPEP_0172509958 /NCGR_PEP_ID=MMETSP1066-20121228/224983_1 /TAXON_ID=671091 /ORGANISM="Coscinodiscus wailesii, Strain CCMP2513" /LENGTH=614 /DNA_ID=CAMNT_0013288721 /DNA_START=285 /DNA_END=2129 /DNA_ORIENTATION=-
MEGSPEGEEVELVADDGSGIMVSFMSAIESAADAEEQRQRIKREWTSGPDRIAPEYSEDVGDNLSEASMPTEIRSEMLKEAAARAVKMLVSPEEHKAQENQLKHLRNESQVDTCTPICPEQGQSRVMSQLQQRMIKPTRQMADLLEAICVRGKWTRRKNACGALKVMTTKKNNRVQMAWTHGVLSAINTVLSESGTEFFTMSEKLAYKEARSRTVAALLNLCLPLDNRIVIMHSPNLISSLTKVILDDRADSRQGVCACLAHLAKTPENRVPMLQVPDLVHTLTGVISVTADFDKSVCGDGSSESSADELEERAAAGGVPPSPLGTRTNTFESDYTGSLSPSVEIQIVPEKEMDKSSCSQQCLLEHLDPYDKTGNHFLNGARVNTFATLLHLAKNKENAYYLGRDVALVSTLVEVSNKFNSPSHSRCVTILAHLTRLPENTQRMVFRVKNLVPTLVRACVSRDDECRKYACFSLQNLSYDKTCRSELALIPNLLKALCTCCMRSGKPDEQLAAVATLRNLSDEPANLIQMSNTPDCFATLMLMAHRNDDSFDEMMQYIACDTLTHLSHWLMKISTSGIMIADSAEVMTENNQQQQKNLKFLTPSHQICDWEKWQ